MLNVTFNNMKVSSSDASTFDLMSAQNESLSDEPSSFLKALQELEEKANLDEESALIDAQSSKQKQALLDADTSREKQAQSDTDIADKKQVSSNADYAVQQLAQAGVNNAEQSSSEASVATKKAESDTYLSAQQRDNGAILNNQSNKARESDVNVDTSQQSNENNEKPSTSSPKAADDLLAQINASNQQKTSVTVHAQTDSTEQQKSYISALESLNKKSYKQETTVNDKTEQNTVKTNQSNIDSVSAQARVEAKSDINNDENVVKANKESLTKEEKTAAQTVQQDKVDVLKGEGGKYTDAKERLADPGQSKPQLNSEWGNLNEPKGNTRENSLLQNQKVITEQRNPEVISKPNELAKQISELVKPTSPQTTQGNTSVVEENLKVTTSEELNKVSTLQQKLMALTPSERGALQQGLQQLVDEGNTTPKIEQALEQLKAIEQKQTLLGKPLSNTENVIAAASDLQSKPVAYNSTKVDKDSRKNDMKLNSKSEQVGDAVKNAGGHGKQDMTSSITSLTQTMPTPQVEQIFKAIATAQPNANLVQPQMSEFAQYVRQLEEAPQNIQHQQSQSTTQKVQVDGQVLQTVNIARNDAAKVLQEKVSMMLNLNNQEAEIRLDPRELGAMQIRIRTDAEQAQVNFVVQNQQAKDLLEQSMPKLKEMLAEQGIELGQSNIEQGDSSQGDQGFDSDTHDGAKSNMASQAQDEQNAQQATRPDLNDGSSIDYYA
ncbi:flagellar hook-length control protein FliK [Pseudoalteromonas sp. A25]|uniref:flagellar hook-length control protein FliK n=1 Tax=Pseudoalteromonas sp. A25 TaxID=116092 RepID=UPI001260EF6F|nr:flagellar hook-length control protein FliK [Pseudoalteromonas sp. A25]